MHGACCGLRAVACGISPNGVSNRASADLVGEGDLMGCRTDLNAAPRFISKLGSSFDRTVITICMQPVSRPYERWHGSAKKDVPLAWA